VSVTDQVSTLRAQIPTAHKKDFDDLVNRYITKKLDANGNLKGKDFKTAESEIGEKATRYARSTDGPQQDYAEVLREVQADLRHYLFVQNGAQAPALRQVNQAWSRYVRMATAEGRNLRTEGFTPDDLLYATKKGFSNMEFARSHNEMKALARAGNDLVNGRPPNWRKYLPAEIGAAVGGVAGGMAGHSVAGPIGAMGGAGTGAAIGAGVGQIGSRARQTPIARGVGRGIERVGGPAGGVAAEESDREPYVSVSGP
jgi:hypothetical protein